MTIRIRPTARAASLVLALLATACTLEAPAPMDAAVETAEAGAPTPVEGYDWIFSSNGGEARLVYGVAHSDNAVVGLSCTDGSGRIALFSDTDPAYPAEFHLESGGDTARIAAVSEPSPMTGGQFLTAEAGASEPVLQRFRRTGWLALWRGEERALLVSQPGSAQNVEQFFTACG